MNAKNAKILNPLKFSTAKIKVHVVFNLLYSLLEQHCKVHLYSVHSCPTVLVTIKFRFYGRTTPVPVPIRRPYEYYAYVRMHATSVPVPIRSTVGA